MVGESLHDNIAEARHLSAPLTCFEQSETKQKQALSISTYL